MPANAPLAPSVTSRTSLSLPTHIITKSWPLGGLLRRRGVLAAVLRDPLVGLGGVAVVDGDLVAALVLEVAGHRDSPSRRDPETPPSPSFPPKAAVVARDGPINNLRRAALTIASAPLWSTLPTSVCGTPRTTMPVTKEDVLAALAQVAGARTARRCRKTGRSPRSLPATARCSSRSASMPPRCRPGSRCASARKTAVQGDPRRDIGDGRAHRRAQGRRARPRRGRRRRAPAAAARARTRMAHGAAAGPDRRARRRRRSSRSPPARAASASPRRRSTSRSACAISASRSACSTPTSTGRRCRSCSRSARSRRRSAARG